MRKSLLALLSTLLAASVVAVIVVALDSDSPPSQPEPRTETGNGQEAPRIEQEERPPLTHLGVPGLDQVRAGNVLYGLEQSVPALRSGVGGGTGGAGGPAAGGDAGYGVSSLPLAQSAEKIIRTTTIEMTVEDVKSTLERIEMAAAAVGGTVSGSSLVLERAAAVREGEEPAPARYSATITIRVPVESYASVMSQLRAAASEIRAEHSEALSVSTEYADLQARLRNLQATETRYLELMGLAEDIPEILSVQDRLNGTRLEIEQVQARIQLLDNLASLATITAALALPPPPARAPVEAAPQPEPEPEPNWANRAWDDAWQASEDILETIGVAAITAGFVLVWLVVPGIVLFGAWWLVRTRAAKTPTPGG